MLEKLDLNQKIKKKAYKSMMPELSNRLFNVEKASWDAGIPVVILFEGWDAAGKGTSIQNLTAPLDPRGFKLYPIRAARTYEKKHPWLWRFWLKLPARGEWAIFDRSWYGRVMVERVEELIPESEWRRAYRDIVDFERTLADDGYMMIKFFLHISKQEQKKRFENLSKDPLEAWHVTPEDWEHHRRYDDWLLAYEEAFERTESEWGPWTIVEATDRRFTRVKIYQTVIHRLEERLKALGVELESVEDEDAGEQEEASIEEESEEEEAVEEVVTALQVAISDAGEMPQAHTSEPAEEMMEAPSSEPATGLKEEELSEEWQIAEIEPSQRNGQNELDDQGLDILPD
ncbi:MAG: polyphosphate kinase 2 family protein [Omnitrophica WOR_2 bacterium]